MELTDRIKASRQDCIAACRGIIKVFKTDKSRRILLAVQLLELCSKNGNLQFHRYCATQEFAKTLAKLLERKRGKSFAAKFYNKEKKRRWDKIEAMLLYLIQLWADAFIMHEDEYPGFQWIYRLLRKEQIAFPMRDPNERLYMGNLVSDSPMYDYIDQITGKAPAKPVKSKEQIQLEQR